MTDSSINNESIMFRTPNIEIPEEQKGYIKATSYSGIKKFETCPYALYLDKVERVPMIGSPAMDRGSKLHKELEEYINGTLDEPTKAAKHYPDLIDEFRSLYEIGQCVPEEQWAFNVDLEPTGWVAHNTWLRLVLDVRVMHDETSASIYDFKSGKADGDPAGHRSQLMLYALFTFLKFPELEHIRAAPIYIDHKRDIHYAEYTRSDLDIFLPSWIERITAVTSCTQFDPKPNQYNCRWCQHRVPQADLNQTEASCPFGIIG